jgi:aminoglycoside phosphotransferase family enzyme/predicted kinase
MDDDRNMQQDVIAFLADPSTHGVDHVTRIDTHAAHVFLAGRRALKIKQAIKYPFLDYSTLERRKDACEQELAINRPFAPQIYRGVVAITREGTGKLAIGGAGEPVEWAVDMTRFDETQTLDHLAASAPVSPALAMKIADLIAAAHETAPIAATELWVRSVSAIIAGNTAAFRTAGLFPKDAIDRLDQASSAALARLRPLMEQRGNAGYVRRCHGDLHLANIVLIENEPVIFDAIEFDAQIASIDVLYDLAFVLMDLIHAGSTAAANNLLNRYLTRTPDANSDALALLPLFMSIRAAVRANVTLARLAQTADRDGAIRRKATSYFDLACNMITPAPPRLVAIGGLSGTGKSVLARGLADNIAPPPGAIVLRSDTLRKKLFGIAETDRLPESAYQAGHSNAVYQTLAHNAERILRQGHSVIVDAVYAREDERQVIAQMARTMGIPFAGIFLVADLDTRIARIAGRSGDASDATPAVARQQQAYDLAGLDWNIVDASGTPAETLARSRLVLSKAGKTDEERHRENAG